MQAFVVHDIAEPLVSFDDFASGGLVLTKMQAGRFEVVGIRREGRVAGYVEIADLGNGLCADFMKPFDDNQIVSSASSLPDLVLRLREHRRPFFCFHLWTSRCNRQPHRPRKATCPHVALRDGDTGRDAIHSIDRTPLPGRELETVSLRRQD